ncbi:hypothetical protein [Bacillus sp. 2205SS5-2]|uniref:hypothetical protein n=1 Tax=Bacillus sp. 2205SS5-2 TaxID=3109031 RepID=UPI003004FBC4
MLVSFIPVLLLGYLFAVKNENLFFLYEWSLILLIIISMILAVRGVLITKDSHKWLFITILVFLLQFSTFSLFLGPFTSYGFFLPFYLISILTISVYVITLVKISNYKPLPVSLGILSTFFMLFMIFLQSIWGVDWR